MAVDIRALSRREAEEYSPSQDYEVCISIRSPEGSKSDLSPGFEAVLRLQFDDVNQTYRRRFERLEEPLPLVPIQPTQALQIVSFYRKHRDCGVLVVHCEAGVSRSVGVARALFELENGVGSEDSQEEFGRGNELVRRRVLEAT